MRLLSAGAIVPVQHDSISPRTPWSAKSAGRGDHWTVKVTALLMSIDDAPNTSPCDVIVNPDSAGSGGTPIGMFAYPVAEVTATDVITGCVMSLLARTFARAWLARELDRDPDDDYRTRAERTRS